MGHKKLKLIDRREQNIVEKGAFSPFERIGDTNLLTMIELVGMQYVMHNEASVPIPILIVTKPVCHFMFSPFPHDKL